MRLDFFRRPPTRRTILIWFTDEFGDFIDPTKKHLGPKGKSVDNLPLTTVRTFLVLYERESTLRQGVAVRPLTEEVCAELLVESEVANDWGNFAIATCYYRAGSGRFGFSMNLDMWTAFLPHTWIFDRKNGTVVDSGTDALKLLRSNMRPFAVAFGASSAQSRDWLQSVAADAVRARVEATKARLKGVTAPTEIDVVQVLNAATPDLIRISRLTDPVDDVQIWSFSDRGEQVTMVSKTR